MKIRTISTIILAPKKFVDRAEREFIQNDEISGLIGITMNDIRDSNNLHNVVPDELYCKAKKINKNAKICKGFVYNYLFNKRPDIVNILTEIPRDYKILSQVELPAGNNHYRYKNLDMGATSNGRIEKIDKDFTDAAIRETLEEAQINLSRANFSSVVQLKKRKDLSLMDLPTHFKFEGVFVYIIII